MNVISAFPVSGTALPDAATALPDDGSVVSLPAATTNEAVVV
jgi:hypothetical protein